MYDIKPPDVSCLLPDPGPPRGPGPERVGWSPRAGGGLFHLHGPEPTRRQQQEHQPHSGSRGDRLIVHDEGGLQGELATSHRPAPKEVPYGPQGPWVKPSLDPTSVALEGYPYTRNVARSASLLCQISPAWLPSYLCTSESDQAHSYTPHWWMFALANQQRDFAPMHVLFIVIPCVYIALCIQHLSLSHSTIFYFFNYLVFKIFCVLRHNCAFIKHL